MTRGYTTPPRGAPPGMVQHAGTPRPAHERASGLNRPRGVRAARGRGSEAAAPFPYLRSFWPGSPDRPRADLGNRWIGSRSRAAQAALDVSDLECLRSRCARSRIRRRRSRIRRRSAGSGSYVAGSGFSGIQAALAYHSVRSEPDPSSEARRIRRRSPPDPSPPSTDPAPSGSGLSNTTWFVTFAPVRAQRVGFSGHSGQKRVLFRVPWFPVFPVFPVFRVFPYSRYSRVFPCSRVFRVYSRVFPCIPCIPVSKARRAVS